MRQTTHNIKRTYCVQMGGSSGSPSPPVIRIEADCVAEIEPGRHLIFTKGENKVGEARGIILAWWIEETVVQS